MSSELSTVYKYYVLFECLLINTVGFFTLFFQCELQVLEVEFLKLYPTTNQMLADLLFGHFWLKDDLNCNSEG